jgi:REP element-mobilizing transposase RayT
MITPEIEPVIYGYIRGRCSEMGVFVHALNGIEDHTHLICSIPPRIAVADFIDKIKGSSSHHINHLADHNWTLYWQVRYGGFTFARKDLDRIVHYVENQKDHHRNGTLWPSVERFGEAGEQAAKRRLTE